MKRAVMLSIVVVGLAVLGSFAFLRRQYSHHNLKSCLVDAGGLRPGAWVRIAGVDVGTVRSVRANPQNKWCPAEVDLELATTYEISIPSDSLLEIDTTGFLGGAYANIDTTNASGSPIEEYGYLKSKAKEPRPSADDYIKAMGLMLKLEQGSGAGNSPSRGTAEPMTVPSR
jgi:ABC-type transporter Mla subunit MlaD